MKKYRTWALVLVILGGLGYWAYKGLTKPLPGEAVTEVGGGKLSQEHVTDIADITYSSNPPAGGKHFPIWAKPGIYDRFISDGYFLHSMEHGYIVIWYNCGKEVSSISGAWRFALKHQVSSVLAHGDEPVKDATQSAKPLMHMTAVPQAGTSWITPENEPEIEVALPDSFKTDSCKNLVKDLTAFTKVAQRVIVTPRINMDTPVALTAWGRILKLNSVDKNAIENFIKTFHNRGPEQTME